MPGSHVDVMALSGNGADAQAKPVLSDAEVVAVGAQIEKTETGVAAPANNVTFALTPQQAGKLLKATATGRIYLALRNDNDRTPVNTEAQVAQPIQIITKLPPPPPVIVVQQVPAKFVTPAAKPKFAVDQWAGNSHHEISFEKK
jgi:Flp pilus assembly protein CpaB